MATNHNTVRTQRYRAVAKATGEHRIDATISALAARHLEELQAELRERKLPYSDRAAVEYALLHRRKMR